MASTPTASVQSQPRAIARGRTLDLAAPIDPWPNQLRRLAAVLAGYTLLAAVMTWPLLKYFGSRLGGDLTDPWQTYWGFWWWRHSLEFGSLPMSTHLLWWPDGVSLWFQTWDLPSTWAASALWGWIPNFAVYNLLLFATFPLAGVTCFLLCRELWGGTLAPFLAGCLYTFSIFHFGQALANLHVASMEWSPLYFLGLVKLLRRPGYGGPVLAGVGLGFTFLASAYHLMFCLVGTVLVLSVEWMNGRTPPLSRALLKQVAVLVGAFAIVAGWLVIGMIWSYSAQAYVGAHDPVQYSADLQSFFFPNAASAWAGRFPAWRAWTGSAWSSAGYVGYVGLVLALVGAWRVPRARAYVFAAAIGAYLALGPLIHIAGFVYPGMILPYAWMQRVVPLLKFGGIPSRFSWLVAFGIAVAAGSALARLSERGVAGRMCAIGLTALALLETWPHAFTTSLYPTPAPMVAWASDSNRWAVLDATSWPRALWHQTLHHHPMLAGYVSRAPARLWDEIHANTVIASLFPAPIGPITPVPLAVSPDEARHQLTALAVRFVIEEDFHTDLVTGLGLRERYRGDGLVIYEVQP